MKLATLETLTNQLTLAYESGDLEAINAFLNQHNEQIAQLTFGDDSEYNEKLEFFIRLYLGIQRSLEEEKKELSSALKNLQGTRKGLKEYNKATPSDRS